MKNSQEFSHKVIKGSLIAILFSFFGSVSAYFIRVFYSHTLTIETYGLFYAVFGLFNILSGHIDFGFGEAVTYLVPKFFKSKKYQDLWNTFIYGQVFQVGATILTAIIFILLAPILSTKYFKVPGSENLIYIFCIFLIVNSFLNSLLQIFTGLQKEKYYSTINALKPTLVLIFSIIFFLFWGGNITFYSISWVLACFLTALVFSYLLWSRYPYLTKSKLSWNKEIFKLMKSYPIPAFMTNLFYSLMSSSDIFFLTLFRNIREV